MIVIGARKSPLSQAQVQEFISDYPHLEFKVILVETKGDLDKKTSLRTLDKTDFFTKEIDQMLLNGECDIGLHSAKDLPEPLPKGLKLLFMTKGVDPRDALVLREGEKFEELSKGAKIATSSERREQVVRKLRSDLTFIDIRGTIEERLAFLEQKKADGVVIAEAALIRLKLNSLNRILLPGQTAKNQGRLAVIVREEEFMPAQEHRLFDTACTGKLDQELQLLQRPH